MVLLTEDQGKLRCAFRNLSPSTKHTSELFHFTRAGDLVPPLDRSDDKDLFLNFHTSVNVEISAEYTTNV